MGITPTKISKEAFTAELFADRTFMSKVYEGTVVRIWDETEYQRENNRSVRYTANMARYFLLTLMVQISELSSEEVNEISKLLGTEYSKGLICERTKQNKSKKDS